MAASQLTASYTEEQRGEITPLEAFRQNYYYRDLFVYLTARCVDVLVTTFSSPLGRLVPASMSVSRHAGDRFVALKSWVGFADVDENWALIDSPQWWGFNNPAALAPCASSLGGGITDSDSLLRCAEELRNSGIPFLGHSVVDFRISPRARARRGGGL